MSLDLDGEVIRKVEAILYSSRSPVSIKLISQILSVDPLIVRRAVMDLRRDYEKRDGALEVASYGYKYRIQLKSQYFSEAYAVSPPDISGSEMKVIANIAISERGLSLTAIKKIAHQRTDQILGHLEDMGLVRSVSRGNSRIYTLGRKFESYFGISKEEFAKRIRSEIANKSSGDDGSASNQQE
ncbi:SMC-Scp complex subunit ScpB [Thermoplasma sp.]|uniref:SMC-Scp complex subunit ScpB n=1 Tax=Thermoplasma sp. TaxID=1973142 RepID=UPI0012705A2E|nr:SMC-Scp complex subunit ScpB [Thermoplasma sp.]KAA8923486.1 MAG: SMC-Scp complex subunit ScpB [Thermoplasma sp.]